MAGLSDTAEQALLSALLNNDSTALDAIIGATLYMRLYTADPTDSGTATTSEVSGLTGYNGVAVTSSTAWSGTGASRTNAVDFNFPTITAGGPVTATHAALCTTQSGAGSILLVFPINGGSGLSISSTSNYSPRIPAGQLSIAHGGMPAGTCSAILDAVLKNDKTALNALMGATRYLRAYSADPSSGTAVTNEVSYTGYTGASVTSSSGWTTSGTRSNTGVLNLGTCTAGSASVTHYSLCTTAASSAGALILVFPRGSALTINNTTNSVHEAAIGAFTATLD